jgi:hypothetical protein
MHFEPEQTATPTALDMPISPPINVTSWRAMVVPSPVPP